MFDLNVDSINVTLSPWRWLDGKDLVKDAVIKSVRGVLGMLFHLVSQVTLLLTLLKPSSRSSLGSVVS